MLPSLPGNARVASPPMPSLPTIPLPMAGQPMPGSGQQQYTYIPPGGGGGPGSPVQSQVQYSFGGSPMSPGTLEQQMMQGGQIRPHTPLSPMKMPAGVGNVILVGSSQSHPQHQQQQFVTVGSPQPQPQPQQQQQAMMSPQMQQATFDHLRRAQQQQQQQQQQEQDAGGMMMIPGSNFYNTIEQAKGTARGMSAEQARQQQRAFAAEREKASQKASVNRVEALKVQVQEQEAIIRKQASSLSELKERERRALAHPGAVEVAPEAFAEENEKIKHITGEIEAGKRKVNSLMRELMQSKDTLDQEIQLSKSVLPVHPRLLEELQAEHAWLKQRVKQREIELEQQRESNIVLEKSSQRLKAEHMVKEDTLHRDIAALEHKLRQKRDRVASIREECDAARGALKARESDNIEASRVGKKEQRGGLMKEMEAHMQYVEAINQIQDLENELHRLEKKNVHVNRAADRARRQLQNREDIENALEAVRMVQPPPRNFPRTDDDQFTAANRVDARAGTSAGPERIETRGVSPTPQMGQRDLFGRSQSPPAGDNTWT